MGGMPMQMGGAKPVQKYKLVNGKNFFFWKVVLKK
jgi:hypothetical protein